VISVTKSAINKEKEPLNTYLQVSDKQAWALLNKWKNISPALAQYSFRASCGFSPVPQEKLFKEWVASQEMSINNLFPSIKFTGIKQPDLSIGSLLLGNFSSYKNTTEFSYKIQELQAENPDILLAGGYLEARPVYSTASFKMEGNNGPEYRTHHLGMDFWLEANTPVHAICDGEIISYADNAADKDYGPTIIIKHEINNELLFYTLYGHLSKESLVSLKKGMKIKKGDRVGFIGNKKENGNWPPHLHFQIILDLLGYETNFPGVCSPAQLAVWSSLCPDPGLLFNSKEVSSVKMVSDTDLINERKKHLGKSLSLSYSKPLKILRGEMQWLIDETGRPN
jgi:murein DD-endopeptidase MepM/ murein hydrolase activator NlpD